MKKWIKIIIIVAVIIVLFIVGVEFAYKSIIRTECCACDGYCKDEMICIAPAVCCKCNYNTLTKLMIIINDYIL